MNQVLLTALRATWSSARRTALGLLIAVLLVSNIATLLSERFHDALVGAITSVAALGGATLASKVLSHSAHARKQAAVVAATREAQSRLAAQNSKLQALERQHAELSKQTKLLADRQRRAAQQTQQLANRAKQRLARTVARSTGALAGQAVPALGVVVTVGVTTLAVVDACDTLKDWNTNLALHDQAPLDTAAVCGVRVPSSSEVLAGLSSTWRQSADLVAAELTSMKLAIERPIAAVPTAAQLRRSTCPVVKIAGLCN
jgi:hypothetical protein